MREERRRTRRENRHAEWARENIFLDLVPDLRNTSSWEANPGQNIQQALSFHAGSKSHHQPITYESWKNGAFKTR